MTYKCIECRKKIKDRAEKVIERETNKIIAWVHTNCIPHLEVSLGHRQTPRSLEEVMADCELLED